ncbi:IS5/IS1182 family transposase, partial [Kitasatospora sp. NPDC101447]
MVTPGAVATARWALIEPTLTAWRQERTARALAFGRPPEHELRDLLD